MTTVGEPDHRREDDANSVGNTNEDKKGPAEDLPGILVYASPSTCIYRAVANEDSDHKVVAIKCLAESNPSPEDLSCLRNEYNVLKGLPADCAGVRAVVCEARLRDGRDAIHLEWADGISLEGWIEAHPPLPMVPCPPPSDDDEEDTEDTLRWKADLLVRVRIARDIAAALASLHGANVIHNNIAADNIIVDVGCDKDDNSTRCAVKIIDLGFASLSHLSEYDDGGEHVNDDLYTVGSVLTTLFLGKASRSANFAVLGPKVPPPPLQDMGPPRASVARASIVTDELGVPTLVWPAENLPADNDVPRSVSALLSNLEEPSGMSTAADTDPYHSARELQEDLQQMLNDPEIFLFDPHEDEVTCQLNFSRRKLYGRAEEMATLLDVYGRIVDGGRSEMVLIRGHAGTGKSVLVQQVRDSMLDRGGYFIGGKFDQLCRGEPYSAFAHAFNELCALILTQDLFTVRLMAATIQNAVGSQGKVLTNVIPKLSSIIGVQADVANVRGEESQNRFNFVFRMFARTIAKPAHPLVLFLDDLQWADAASTNLIKALVTDPHSTSFLIVGCYRDDEVSHSHPLAVQLRDIERRDVLMTTIETGNLEEDVLNTMISETLRLPRRLTASLAEIVHRKTLGNAFLAVQFLSSLCDLGILQFSFDLMRWLWDETRARMESLSDDVVELMAGKIQKLPAASQGVLKVAAGIGSHFDEFTLRRIMAAQEDKENKQDMGHGMVAIGKDDLAEILKSLVREGLVDKLMAGSKYKFSHDRIQQAAYSLIPSEQWGLMHLQIGRLIRRDSKGEDVGEMLFRSVDHLNLGTAFMCQVHEKIELATLNLQAGERATLSSAFIPAAAYLKAGINLLDQGHWETNYSLSLRLYTSLAENEYCNGNFDQVEHIAEEVFKHARTFQDTFLVYSSLIKSLGAKGKMHEAIDTGFHVLSQLGEPFPKSARKHVILVNLLKTKLMLKGRTDSSLSTLPAMTDQGKIAAMQMLSSIFALVYISKPKYAPLIAFRMVQLSLKYGATNESPFGFMTYGVIMCGLGDFKEGCRFGGLSLLLLDRCDAKEWVAHVYAPCHAAIKHWREPIQDTLGPFLYGYRIGMEMGDNEYAMYGLYHYCHFSFESGQPLAPLEKEMSAYCKQMVDSGQDTALKLTLPIWQCALNLMGRTEDPLILTGEAMDEELLHKEILDAGNNVALYTMYVERLFLGFMFGDYKMAAEMALISRDIAQATPAMLLVLTQGFYDGLTSFALAREDKHKKWVASGCRAIKKMKKWAKNSPENCLHKLLLLQAEKAVVKGKKAAARNAYDAAIAAANKNGFIQEEALAYERAGFFTKELSDQVAASHYFSRAHQLYLDWGAQAKADCLYAQMPLIITPAKRRSSFQSFLRGRSSVSPQAN